MWGPNDEVHRKVGWNREANLERLVELIARRHHHQNVDVAIGVRGAVGMGAEQDDFVRTKQLGNTTCEAPDNRRGDACAFIPAFGLVRRWTFGRHAIIVYH
jgi:hypothetical protein